MKLFYFLGIIVLVLTMASCDRTEYEEIDSIIVSKVVHEDGTYWLHLEYQLEGFEEPLEAQVSVKQREYNQYIVGDSYILRRPIFKQSR